MLDGHDDVAGACVSGGLCGLLGEETQLSMIRQCGFDVVHHCSPVDDYQTQWK